MEKWSKKIGKVSFAVVAGILLMAWAFIRSISVCASELSSKTEPTPETVVQTAPTEVMSEMTPETAPEPLSYEQLFVIDDSNIYPGMDRAYKDGYSPLIVEGNLYLVLPLNTRMNAPVTMMQATLDLGSGTETPFCYRNYQQTIGRSWQKINSSEETKEVFYVFFSMPLRDDRINGSYPVTVRLSYTIDNISYNQDFLVYVEICDGKDADAPEVVYQPKIMVIDSIFESEKIYAGDAFSTTVVLKNMSKDTVIRNMTITVSCSGTGITLEEKSNTFYFEKLGAEKELQLPLSFSTTSEVTEGQYSIQLSMNYDTYKERALLAEGCVYFQVYQKAEVEFESGEISQSITAGDSEPLAIQIINKGRSKIHNVSCCLQVPGLSSGKSLFLGNVEGGMAASGEMTIFAGSKDPQAETDEERYGDTYGKLILSYEDAEGTVYTEEKDVYTKILPLVIETENDEGEAASIEMQLRIAVTALGLIVLSNVCFLIYHKKGKGAKAVRQQ